MQRWKPTKTYWKNYSALYGQAELGEGLPVKPKPKKKKTKIILPTEQQEQFVAVAWLRKNNVLFYHVPNGGRRDYLEAAKFKRLGVSAGVPDLCLPLARKGYHGLYIELKRQKGGVVSVEQQEWVDWLNDNGFYARVAKGFEEAKMILRNSSSGF